MFSSSSPLPPPPPWNECTCLVYVYVNSAYNYACFVCISRIQFPDPHARYRSNQVIVNGTVDAVLQAREELLVCMSMGTLLVEPRRNIYALVTTRYRFR